LAWDGEKKSPVIWMLFVMAVAQAEYKKGCKISLTAF
jgi:hypothetical protein